LTGIK